MDQQTRVLEYKCPCCNAGLVFSGEAQQLTCEYCGNSFDLDAVRAFNDSQEQESVEQVQWDNVPEQQWTRDEQQTIQAFQCPSCGGEILTDQTTAAS